MNGTLTNIEKNNLNLFICTILSYFHLPTSFANPTHLNYAPKHPRTIDPQNLSFPKTGKIKTNIVVVS